jgi:hypothetical protein
MPVRRKGNLMERLENINKQLRSGVKLTLRVGFLEGTTYPDGTSVPMVAAIQDLGAPAAGIPPRPFFRNMIAEHKSEWPGAMKAALISTNYDGEKALAIMGEGIAGQLRQSIVDTNEPPLNPKTIARKGSSKPLVETGHLLQSVDFEIVEK